jgi:uncharacterized protein YecT (DUF1311 family)
MDPDLSLLESDYQILTELHRSDDSRTFLARHLGLNRDVTITVVHGANTDSLKGYDADVARLIALRHQHVIPVIEGRWLGDHEYAIVHARVRGSTLDQLISAVGAVPLPRAASALEQTYEAIVWARECGIVNRHVTPDELVFQQGSGRVLLALTPTSDAVRGTTAQARVPATVIDACIDARTIGELAFMMLTGQRVEDAGSRGLATLRPDLPATLVSQTETLLRCDVNDTIPDVDAYIALLAPLAARGPAAVPERQVALPVAARADAAVVARRTGMGFGARLAMAIAVLVVLGAGAMFMLNRDREPDRRAFVDTTSSADTTEAAGDIALRARQSDSLLAAQAPSMPRISAPANSRPAPMAMTPPATTNNGATTTVTMPPQTRDTQPIPSPLTRRSEPLRPTTPPVTMPDSVAPPTPRPDSAARTVDVCDSPDSSDQHRCLMNAIERNDVGLTEVYQRLITALRRQASVQPDDPDPATVETLRGAQRRWVEQRDSECRSAGTGLLYGRERAACFAEQSEKRKRELQDQLDAIPPA